MNEVKADMKKVTHASLLLKKIVDDCEGFLQVFKTLNQKEQAIVGVLVCSITNPFEVIEFDAAYGNPFIIDASIRRLNAKRQAEAQHAAQARAQAQQRGPSIMPATGKLAN